ncbi:YbfB/YjiJ family MFS transporter [Nocardia inohanensis]|uniref:YbfB/YjiJ family MFS transporter n=1 Tax=Nocardia inohanensis TaxID=209246 RepID=UPI00082E1361|nr:YbfB/YjiJ family MFS transporter [Nocardia inohanensis]
MITADVRRQSLAPAYTAAAGLAAAMGIGRFAYTPLLPVLIDAGRLDAHTGAVIAAANYAGYLAGAVALARRPEWNSRNLFRAAALVLVLSEALMACPAPSAVLAVLRFAAGAASAIIFIACAGVAARHENRRRAAGIVFAGVGAGIALSGLLALSLNSIASWHALWLGAAALTALLLFPAYRTVRPATAESASSTASAHAAHHARASIDPHRSAATLLGSSAPPPTGSSAGTRILTTGSARTWTGGTAAEPRHVGSSRKHELRGGTATESADGRTRADAARETPDATASAATRWRALLVSYFLEGLGYIVIGTFLVAAVKETGGQQLGTGVWVIAGVAAIPATVLWGAAAQRWSPRTALVIALLLQAASAALPMWSASTGAAIVSAALFGATFMGITMLSIEIGTDLAGARAAATLTAVYGFGQMLGPLVVAPALGSGYSLAFGIAAVILVLAATAAFAVRGRSLVSPESR